MVLQLISATPSPYARKVRIQLLEKKIPYELKTEVPWDSTTETPKHNPLEKLPVLIFDDDREPIYESHFIIEYIENKFEPKYSLSFHDDLDTNLQAKQLEVLADSVCDALVLVFFERERGEEKVSRAWLDRQNRKIEGGLKALAGWVEKSSRGEKGSKSGFVLGDQLSIADVAIVSMVDFLRLNKYPAVDRYSVLGEYADKLNEREAFKETMPYMFEIKDQIV